MFHDDATWSEVERSDWDGLGHYRRQVSRSSTTWGETVRESFTDYNPGYSSLTAWPNTSPWVLNTSLLSH